MLVNLNDVLTPAGGYAVGLFNTVNLEMARGVLAAAEEQNAPVIIGTAEVLLPYGPLEELSWLLLPMARRAKVPVVVHLDHGLHYETCRRALELGIRRKRYLIPPTQYEDGREDAPTLLRRAMADYRRGEAELPGLVNGIFLGDRVQFDTGREWLVIRVRWKQSGSTARTHLELADPTYADLYG